MAAHLSDCCVELIDHCPGLVLGGDGGTFDLLLEEWLTAGTVEDHLDRIGRSPATADKVHELVQALQSVFELCLKALRRKLQVADTGPTTWVGRIPGLSGWTLSTVSSSPRHGELC